MGLRVKLLLLGVKYEAVQKLTIIATGYPGLETGSSHPGNPGNSGNLGYIISR